MTPLQLSANETLNDIHFYFSQRWYVGDAEVEKIRISSTIGIKR